MFHAPAIHRGIVFIHRGHGTDPGDVAADQINFTIDGSDADVVQRFGQKSAAAPAILCRIVFLKQVTVFDITTHEVDLAV